MSKILSAYGRNWCFVESESVLICMKEWTPALLEDGWSLEETVGTLNVCPRSINRWQHNFDVHSRVDPPSGLRGRPRILTSNAIQSFLDLLTDAPFT